MGETTNIEEKVLMALSLAAEIRADREPLEEKQAKLKTVKEWLDLFRRDVYKFLSKPGKKWEDVFEGYAALEEEYREKTLAPSVVKSARMVQQAKKQSNKGIDI